MPSEIRFPVHVQVINRAYGAGERIPWETARTVATCRTKSGLLRRWRQERTNITHQNAYSGHIRCVDANGALIDMATLDTYGELIQLGNRE
jgi:hypothetical protein